METQRQVVSDALVLIVEDDQDIARILRQYVERAGWRSVVTNDGEAGLLEFNRVNPDIVLLDVNLPKRDGFSVLEQLRAQSDTPVIVVSARIEDEDKLKGLGLGADDYVVKPFNPNEVIARIRAVLHRTRSSTPVSVLRYANIKMDVEAGRSYVGTSADETLLNLTPSEHKILALMIQTPNKVFSRSEILGACFPESEALERTVDSHVSHLRKKLAAAGAEDVLSVMRGVGYRFGQ